MGLAYVIFLVLVFIVLGSGAAVSCVFASVFDIACSVSLPACSCVVLCDTVGHQSSVRTVVK